MRITIIPADGNVGVNGEFRQIAGLQASYPNVHAVQFDGVSGHIEYSDGRPNLSIVDMVAFQGTIDAWNALTPPAPTVAQLLAQAQTAQLAKMQSAYDAAISALIVYMGATFQADKASRDLIASVLSGLGGATPPGFGWYDVNNIKVAMTNTQLQGLAGTILLRGQPLFDQLQARKAAIRAALDVVSVQAVIW